MSWCNKLASTPSIGFKLTPMVAPGDSILQSLSPILEELINGDTPEFSIEKHESLGFGFNSHEGFRYVVDLIKIHVEFNHRMRARQITGGAPVMELLSKAQPFTELLPIVGDKLVRATLLLPGTAKRKLRRVGIISHTRVDEDSVPPGIEMFLDYVARPWGKRPLPHYDVTITTVLREDANTRDRCIHVLKKTEDPNEIPTIHFDWQREFLTDRLATEQTLESAVEDASKSALQYFEQLAEGDLFDDSVIKGVTKSG